ncbi:DUF4157 domain-containing protein [Saccharothrix australiensis]|uniref:Uncharacterized protein DUF4157 n=1 Tax=Saccharothrix australiensis TaxID=2072 RepID=A0A495VYE3_9PSEU|nr:DUF4157 domain-containing protein [Saccharothrix australiensis]RKT53757.1 uncharacterized protein DUF4157 [Saccharothrix australiensis]
MHTPEHDKHPDGNAPGRAPARSRAQEPRAGLLGLQRTLGNRAVVEMLQRSGHPGASTPVQRSSVRDVLRRPGEPLDDATRVDMESRLGADFTDVRVHTDAAAQRSAAEIGARAYTSGSHIVIGAGGADRHTLAHELIHVVQQRSGPVAGTDNGDGLRVSDPGDRFEREAEAGAGRALSMPTPAQRAVTGEEAAGDPRATGFVQRRFAPFTGAMTPSGVGVAGLGHPLDTLQNSGLTYPNGATRGNLVAIEQLFQQTGGNSQPGYPVGFREITRLFPNAVGEEHLMQVATAMHAINAGFVAGANNVATNIFMGTATANRNHSNEVEVPLRQAMQGLNNAGRAAAYEWVMGNLPPLSTPNAPHLRYWIAPNTWIPGALVPGPQVAALLPQGATHYVDTTRLYRDLSRLPKIVVYRVRPNYVANYLPDYVLDNIDMIEEEAAAINREITPLLAAGAQLTPRDQYRIGMVNTTLNVVRLLRGNGPLLFPKTFTASAQYWLPTYDSAAWWAIGGESTTLAADTV